MSADLPDAAYGLALLSLPGIGPARLARLMTTFGARDAWAQVAAGTLPADHLRAGLTAPDDIRSRWVEAAVAISPAALLERSATLGATVKVLGEPGFPAALADDPVPPPVLSWLGDPAMLERPTVAVVGTRNATSMGRSIARELAGDLAGVGVTVVSGLALGIDAAAHTGALEADGHTAAVVGSGLDVVYPEANRALWRRIGAHGLLLSECAPGQPPTAWRFPRRNRLIAALAQVVVVVESRVAGGSLHTVDEALRRSRTVMAVPGSVRSAASAGTNQLLADGAELARDAADVLSALGLVERPPLTGPPPLETASPVLAALAQQPFSLDGLAMHLGWSVAQLAVELTRLEALGLVRDDDGWYELAHHQRGAK